MNQEKFNKWRNDVRKVFYSQILLDDLKKIKKISKKQQKEIKNKINK